MCVCVCGCVWVSLSVTTLSTRSRHKDRTEDRLSSEIRPRGRRLAGMRVRAWCVLGWLGWGRLDEFWKRGERLKLLTMGTVL